MRYREVYVGLGSNLDGPAEHIRRAVRDIEQLAGTRVVAASGLYRSAPLGGLDQPDYCNAALQLETDDDADTLFAKLQTIERAHGRTPEHGHWDSRTLDLDLLVWGEEVRDDAQLRLPHPGIAERAFVLAPLCEINPRLAVPGLGAVSDLLRLCPQEGTARIGSVWQLPEAMELIAVEGLPGSGKTELCNLLAGEFDAKLVLENYGSNPFLDSPGNVFAAQLHFLTHRIQRFSGVVHPDLFQPHTVMDFTLARSDLWARRVLSEQEYDLWLQVSSHLRAPLPSPNLVILLQQSPPPATAGHDAELLHTLAHDMHTYFARQSATVLTVDIARAHPARDAHAWRHLLNALGSLRPGGRLLLDAAAGADESADGALSLGAA